MRWATDWWGIMIFAETEKDRKMLDELSEMLPESAMSYYDEGKMELYESDDGEPVLELRR